MLSNDPTRSFAAVETMPQPHLTSVDAKIEGGGGADDRAVGAGESGMANKREETHALYTSK
jgi:hypothetical protein